MPKYLRRNHSYHMSVAVESCVSSKEGQVGVKISALASQLWTTPRSHQVGVESAGSTLHPVRRS